MIENASRIFRIGPIRPPSEADSLLLQVTKGCPWNQCKFCQLYRHSPFKIYSVESIKNDIDTIAYYAEIADRSLKENVKFRNINEVANMTSDEKNCFYFVYNWLSLGGENVFLQDGNSLALKVERIEEVLLYLRSKFPRVKRVTTYARAETLSKITMEQFKALKAAGLDRIHSGFETGSDKVLELIHKGTTSEQEITAGKNIKAAGIEFSIYFMPGIGGKALSEENAAGTATVIQEIDPDYVRIRTAVITKECDLWQDFQKGTFQICSDNEKLMEIKQIIENTAGCTGNLVNGDHIINLLPGINGRLDLEKGKMLSLIDEYLLLPALDQRLYQLARRAGMVSGIGDVENLTTRQKEDLRYICQSIKKDSDWDEKINEMMQSFV